MFSQSCSTEVPNAPFSSATVLKAFLGGADARVETFTVPLVEDKSVFSHEDM